MVGLSARHSLSDLVSMLSEQRSRDIDLYLHQQALDTSTPSGRALFGMLSVFKIGRIRAALDDGRGVRETARLLKVSPAKVSQVRRMRRATADLR